MENFLHRIVDGSQKARLSGMVWSTSVADGIATHRLYVSNVMSIQQAISEMFEVCSRNETGRFAPFGDGLDIDFVLGSLSIRIQWGVAGGEAMRFAGKLGIKPPAEALADAWDIFLARGQ